EGRHTLSIQTAPEARATTTPVNPVMKHILMIAFHFPPAAASRGVQRTLAFSRYLPEFGWAPLVLTAHPRAHGVHDNAQWDGPGVVVKRAFALDTARHL